MKIHLHIGSDKTGTTAIQAVLTSNRKILMDNGVLYPELEKSPHQEILARELVSGEKGPAWEALEKHIASKPKHLIISSEMFCSLSRQNIQRFKSWVGDADINVIAYLRSADEYLESGVLQRLKASKSRRNFFKLYRKVKWVPAPINPLVYIAALKPLFVYKWANIFGKDSLKVRPYCKSQWEDSDLLSDFMRTLELEHLTDKLVQPHRKENITPNIYTVFAMSSFAQSSYPPLRHKFSEIMTTNFEGATAKTPISSYYQRRLAKMLGSKIFNRIYRQFRCPPPQSEPTKESLAPSELSLIETAQMLLVEFSIFQRKQINSIENKLRKK